MFNGPARLRPLSPVLRRLSPTVAARIVSALAIADAMVRRDRMRQVFAWSGAQRNGRLAGWRLAFEVLSNHGRFVADEAMLGMRTVEEFGRDAEIIGRERLDRLEGGALLLGFHLGPPRTPIVLRSLGYPVKFAARMEAAVGDARWQPAFDTMEAVRLPGGAPRERAEGLHRVRALLRDGALVYLAADGPFGREAFRIDLPGRALSIRPGWMSLRRIARVPVLPVLTYLERGRRIVCIHAPLPQAASDLGEDIAACRAALTPLVSDYVRRFPGQCRYLALQAW